MFFLCCVAFFSKAKVEVKSGEPQKKKSCLKPETSMYKCFLHNQETWQPDGVSSDVPEVRKWLVNGLFHLLINSEYICLRFFYNPTDPFTI